MNARNCKSCGRIFNYLAGPPLCPVCREDLEKKFQEVKTYISEHKGVPVSEVAEECNVSEKQIKQWVKEERLEFAPGVPCGIECEVCGEPIPSGRFCAACKTKVISDLNGAIPKAEKPTIQKKSSEGPKMRFLDNR